MAQVGACADRAVEFSFWAQNIKKFFLQSNIAVGIYLGIAIMAVSLRGALIDNKRIWSVFSSRYSRVAIMLMARTWEESNF